MLGSSLKQSMGHSGAILPPTSTKYQIMEEQCNVAAERSNTEGGLATCSCSMPSEGNLTVVQ